MNRERIMKLILTGFFIIFSYIGSLVKFSGSIALDSLPAYFSAIILGPLLGGFVGLVGHLLTALTSGFPMTLPMHLFISVMMFIIVFLFSIAYRKGNFLGIILGIILNGPVAATLSAYIFANLVDMSISFWNFISLIIVPLTLASSVNIIFAHILYKAIPKKYYSTYW
ncbi:ECF transporter S component [Anaerobranca gottschalkii]|uniref:Alpha-ribazole transporter n=1 Tax=Anaerobranca gottschalkii DSM 13577 TaxID=1120990 RepID=A0A1I0A1C6_9FIRM|nr:ECF transporter S component [Anaerobranca gottschalkii]SES87832.1 alpha-ribazole transporter [Anaerobranca gottschalkii DSM 13577]